LNPVKQVMIEQVADEELDVLARHFPPQPGATMQRHDRQQRLDAFLEFPLPLGEVVDDGDLIAASGEMQRGRPPEIAVAA